MSKETMKLALEALEDGQPDDPYPYSLASKAIAALREALANEALDKKAENARELGLDYEPAQQEPVARQYQNRDGVWKDFISEKHYKDTLEDGSWPIRNLYTSPPAQRTWVGLTATEVHETEGYEEDRKLYRFARAIEAKLRSKNEDRN